MNYKIYTTKEMAEAIDVPYGKIIKAIFNNKIDHPEKVVGTNLLWTPEEADAVAKELTGKRTHLMSLDTIDYSEVLAGIPTSVLVAQVEKAIKENRI